MVVPWLFHAKERPIHAYTPETGASLLPCAAIRLMPEAYGGHKKASRVAPARVLAHPVRDESGCVRYHDAGIRTVSTTWITPFD